MRRMRTYFLPLCVLSGFFLLSGLACGILLAWAGDAYDGVDQHFIDVYGDGGSYRALYSDGLKLRRENSELMLNSVEAVVIYTVALGLALLGWAFDRRRLVKKLNALPAQESDAHSRDDL